jgi:Diphthamide synthase subunit DPH2
MTDLAERLRTVGARRVNVSAVLQHVHLIPKLRKFLEARGFETSSGMARPPYMLEGQVLGCDYYAVRDDSDALSTSRAGGSTASGWP